MTACELMSGITMPALSRVFVCSAMHTLDTGFFMLPILLGRRL